MIPSDDLRDDCLYVAVTERLPDVPATRRDTRIDRRTAGHAECRSRHRLRRSGRSRGVTVSRSTSPVAGIDLGATHVRAAVADSSGAMLGYVKRETPGGVDGQAIAEAVRETLELACDDAGVGTAAVGGIGVGSLGPLDRAAGAVVDPPNLPGVERVPLVEALSEYEADVTLYNDATAGALGVRAAGDAPDNIVYVTISTGLGAGAIVDGNALVGERGNAAEVGHLTLDPDSPVPCGCGGRGHWEAFAAGDNVPTYARHLARERDLETDLPLGSLTAKAVFDAAGEDPLATAAVDAIGEFNALGVAAVVHAYDPAVVVLGGAVAVNNPDAVLEPVRERLPDLVVEAAPEVRITSLGDRTVLTGALAAAREGTLDADPPREI